MTNLLNAIDSLEVMILASVGTNILFLILWQRECTQLRQILFTVLRTHIAPGVFQDQNPDDQNDQCCESCGDCSDSQGGCKDCPSKNN